MRFEIRDPEGPESRMLRERGTKHELVIITYESPDGKTRHSNVQPMSDDDLIELTVASLRRLAETPDVDLHSVLGAI